jgi:hypothetical protein
VTNYFNIENGNSSKALSPSQRDMKTVQQLNDHSQMAEQQEEL